jgi:hypothetical protein
MPNSQTGGQSNDEPPTVQKTLNGYDQAVAQQMIANFAANYLADNNPKSATDWYSITDLTNIYNLLTSETLADGVRFYFGCDAPAPGTTALTLTIFLVSTQYRSQVTGTQSQHADYYNHTAAYLNNGPFGSPANDTAAASLAAGALLYGANVPTNVGCQNPSQHYLDTSIVYPWVQRRCETNNAPDASPLNTRAEWFQVCFISALFYSIINAPVSYGFDGLRVYLGKGYQENGAGDLRDVVILVPTKGDGHGNHIDYNGCLEDLLETPFCSDASVMTPTTEAQQHRVKETARFRTAIRAKSFWEGGGYDNGELCPTHCP